MTTISLPVLQSIRPRLNSADALMPRMEVFRTDKPEALFANDTVRSDTLTFVDQVTALEANEAVPLRFGLLIQARVYKYMHALHAKADPLAVRATLEEILALVMTALLDENDIQRFLGKDDFSHVKVVNEQDRKLIEQLRRDLRDTGVRNKLLENEIKQLRDRASLVVTAVDDPSDAVDHKDQLIDQQQSTIDALNLTLQELKASVTASDKPPIAEDGSLLDDMRREIVRLKTTVSNLTGRASAPKSVLASVAMPDTHLIAPAKSLLGKLNTSNQTLEAANLLKEHAPDISAATRKRAFQMRDDAVHTFMAEAVKV